MARGERGARIKPTGAAKPSSTCESSPFGRRLRMHKNHLALGRRQRTGMSATGVAAAETADAVAFPKAQADNDETIIGLWLNSCSRYTIRTYEADVRAFFAHASKPLRRTCAPATPLRSRVINDSGYSTQGGLSVRQRIIDMPHPGRTGLHCFQASCVRQRRMSTLR